MADYDGQRERRLIQCPHCDSTEIKKAPMAPRVKRARRSDYGNFAEMCTRIRKEISENCDDVGTQFAEEARAIHYGEKPKRGIYGQASPGEAKALHDEGVAIAPLPDQLVPKKKLN